MGSVGDIQSDPYEVTKARYDVVARYPGRVIAGIKPRPNANYITIIRLAEAANALMITIDIDAAAGWQSSKETGVEPKTVDQLSELVGATKIQILVKGITTPEDALLAGEAGAAGICVSDHGGRVLDHTAGTATYSPRSPTR